MSTTHPSLPPSPAPPPGPADPSGPAAPTAVLAQHSAAPPQGRLLLPGERLIPSPGRDRPWRVLTVLLGASVVLLLVGGLAVASAANWAAGRGYTEIASTAGLGSPASLRLDSMMGTVQVLPSDDVDEVTLALVEPGATGLPSPQDTTPARLTQNTDSAGTTWVTVAQPQSTVGWPWDDRTRDVLLLVPSGLELSLGIDAGVGDVLVDGTFHALEVRADVGNVVLEPLSVSDTLTVSSEIGEVEIELESPAPAITEITAAVGNVSLQLPTDSSGALDIVSNLGDVSVTAPGTTRWQVDADSELGQVWVDPGVAAGAGDDGTLSVTADLGDITIER
ncbi:hypothetical protein GCM10023160_16780 [Brachybacterium paraconglomeratum]|uniref:hypothetical protein n=1 Tax=Brachybacterium paraconglomeratum TaxID=173362 RepID=UPI0031ED0493